MLAEGDDGIWSPSQAAQAALACAAHDWRPLYEGARARAEAAEARCEELRRAELASRSRAGSLQSQLDASRNKLKAAEEETKGVCRTAKNALALQAEVTRLEKLLSEAGVETSKRSTIMSLRMEIARLRKAAPGSEARPRKAPGRSRNLFGRRRRRSRRCARRTARLKKEARAAKLLEGRIRFLDGEIDNLRYSLRASHAHKERIEARHQSSSSRPRGIRRWVERCCPSTRHARRSEIPSRSRTWSMDWRRREGLKSFPGRPPPVSACPASDRKPHGVAARSPSQAP